MPRPERPPAEPADAGARADKKIPDPELLREYGQKYIEIQRLILAGLPTEKERLAWAERYGGSFHDLAAADSLFHELVISDSPDIQEISRRVIEYADSRDAGSK